GMTGRRIADCPGRRVFPLLLLGLATAAGCSFSNGVELEPGIWRAVLKSPGGDLPFTLRISRQGGKTRAVALNGAEEVPFSSVEVRQGQVILRIDGYDSQLEARLNEDGSRLTGEWVKRAPNGYSRLGFEAVHGDGRRFLPVDGLEAAAEAALEDVSGSWRVVFAHEDSETPARGEFVQRGDRLTGTFLTPVGDYRYLEGEYRNGLLRLSCFDGAHAFLFIARAQPDGSLKGDFWSRDRHSASWTARPLGEGEPDPLPNPYQEVWLTNSENRFEFRFPDLDGKIVSNGDARFEGKVVLVNIFGSWCPNCNDEAPILAQWHQAYWDEGLEIVGLAYEISGDPERDREYVRKYAQRHGLRFPLLLAGISNKEAAGSTLPDLSRVRSYPTNIFISRDGAVRRIHSGFAGPAAGEEHERLVRELEGLIRVLLDEEAGRDFTSSR
ncbi:MAG: TlpA disulfide reductase family protein, partial [Acidobacteriota bacterium]